MAACLGSVTEGFHDPAWTFGQSKREGKMKVPASSGRTDPAPCAHLRVLSPHWRNDEDPKAWRKKTARMSSQALFQAQPRSAAVELKEKSGTFISERIVLDLLSHWTQCNDSRLRE